MTPATKTQEIAIIGGGPAGLMAAEHLSAVLDREIYRITVYDAMPSLARKFLLAGKSGLNITHSEPYERFATRFGSASARLGQALDAFTPEDVRNWAAGLGTETFTGTSGRVFPTAMKASPLLRAWLKRLDAQGVSIRTRHRFCGFGENGGLMFETPDDTLTVQAEAVLLALGGASWPRLGSDAAWMPWLAEKGVETFDFLPANCGFDILWSETFRERFSGAPVKSVMATSDAGSQRGEFVISKHGIEGSLVYAHAAALRDRLLKDGKADLILDLAPDRTAARLARDLEKQGQKASFSNRLRKGAGIEGVKLALLRELTPDAAQMPAAELAGRIKALPLPLDRPRPIAEAISSQAGLRSMPSMTGSC